MPLELDDDRPGRNRKINTLWDVCVNKYTGRFCLKTRLINDSGVASVYGEVIHTSQLTDFAFQVAVADDPECIGVVYEAGIAAGSLCWVVTYGSAEVLLEDATASTHGYWARISITDAGRADITNPAPPGGGVVEIDRHFRELGHGVQSVTAGTDKLAEVHLHFN